MALLASNDIDIYQGNDKTVRLIVYQRDGTTVYNLTSCSLTMYIKHYIDDDDDDAVITKVSSDVAQININDPTNGIALIYFVPADTSSLEPKVYRYDIELTTGDSKVYTIVRSTFKVEHA